MPAVSRAEALRAVLKPEYLAHGSSYARCAARALKAGVPNLTRAEYDAVRRDAGILKRPPKDAPKEIRTLEDLVAAGELDQDRFRLKEVLLNAWSPGNGQVKASFLPKPPTLVPAAPVRVRFKRSKTPERRMRALFVPDMHVGHKLVGAPGERPRLVPLHDERAIEIVHMVAEHYQPDVIYNLGDLLDFAALSRFDNDHEHQFVAQHSIQAAHEHQARFRAACLVKKHIAGNHCERLRGYLARQNSQVAAICRANETTPVLSLPYLLRYDELGIEYVGPYGTHDFFDDVRVLHGEKIGNRGGKSAAKHLEEYAEKTVFGHIHRLELAYRTVHPRGVSKRVWSMSCGTLGRVDGALPPGDPYPDWQQGFGVLWAGGQPAVYEISEGASIIDGYRFSVEAKDEAA